MAHDNRDRRSAAIESLGSVEESFKSRLAHAQNKNREEVQA